MIRNLTKIISIFLLIMFIPVINTHALTETNVVDQQELKEALENEDVDTIILNDNINTTEKINITRPVTIDGNGHTIKYTGTFGSNASSDNTVWGGRYIKLVPLSKILS